MILDLVEAFKPKCRKLIQNCAFVRNRVRQNNIKGRETVGRDEQQSVAEVEDFAHFSAAQFFKSGEIDRSLWSGLHIQRSTLNAQRSTFNAQFRILLECWALSVGPIRLALRAGCWTLPPSYGRYCNQSARANPARSRLGFLQR